MASGGETSEILFTWARAAALLLLFEENSGLPEPQPAKPKINTAAANTVSSRRAVVLRQLMPITQLYSYKLSLDTLRTIPARRFLSKNRAIILKGNVKVPR